MPDSKADHTRRSNEEIVNFLEHGDARGPRWLATHPAARERAQQYLASHYRDSAPVEVDLTAIDEATPAPLLG
jgi:hypothetical protein